MNKILRLVMSVGLVVAMLLATAPTPATARTPGEAADEVSFVAKLNVVRVSNGLRPLAVNLDLTNVARNWSSQMAAAGTISHNPNRTSQVPANWSRLGENVGMGPSVDSLHDAFVASPPHYANMVNIYYDSIGVGVVQSGDTKFVTFLFMATKGAPASTPFEPAAPGAESTFTPLTPARVLDTRNGTGQGGRTAKVGPNQIIVVDVTGTGGVPDAGVAAVVMNVTATEATVPSFLSVSPSGSRETSSLNFVPGRDVANLVTVPVGSDGNLRAYNSAGSTHVLFDVVGWYGDAGASGARHNTLIPQRILDTRDGNGAAPGKVGPTQTIALDVTGRGGVPSAAVSAVTLNLTSTEVSTAGYLSVTPSGGNATSSLNLVPGRDVANLVTVPVGPDGNVRIYNGGGATHAVADVVGWYSAPGVSTGASYVPVSPARIVDTRTGTGTAGVQAPVGAGQTLTADVTGLGGVPASGVSAVVVNVTVTEPSAAGFVAVTPEGGRATSSLNFVSGQDVPNLVVVAVGEDGNVRTFNAAGTSHVVFDVVGWFSAQTS